jgi:hypothetical protein
VIATSDPPAQLRHLADVLIAAPRRSRSVASATMSGMAVAKLVISNAPPLQEGSGVVSRGRNKGGIWRDHRS